MPQLVKISLLSEDIRIAILKLKLVVLMQMWPRGLNALQTLRKQPNTQMRCK